VLLSAKHSVFLLDLLSVPQKAHASESLLVLL